MTFTRPIKGAAVLVLAALVFGALLRHKGISVKVQRTWLILTGRLVDVGGYRIHLECQGIGSPTVVMDSGLNMTIDTWGRVPSDVAAFTRVCTYERAGLGFSDSGPRPRTSQQIVNELRNLLVNAGVSGPYILVGHSVGGLNVRLYASSYPQGVAGIVLIDSAHEDQFERFAALKSGQEKFEYLRHESGGNDEGLDLLASAQQIRQAPPLPAVPLVVISARPNGLDSERAKTFAELQAQLPFLVMDGRQIIAEHSGHFVQHDRPFLVADVIQSQVNAVRRNTSR